MGVSVGVGRVDVFGQRLFIVAAFAERLPVILVPEKFLVTTMRNDVIHDRCPDVLALLGTHHTKRMRFQIRLSGFLPPPVVSTLCCWPGSFWVERQVFLTVEPAGFHQLRAAGMMTWCLRSVRHFLSPLLIICYPLCYHTVKLQGATIMITWDTYKKHLETVDPELAMELAEAVADIVNSKDIRSLQESLTMTSDGSDSSVK